MEGRGVKTYCGKLLLRSFPGKPKRPGGRVSPAAGTGTLLGLGFGAGLPHAGLPSFGYAAAPAPLLPWRMQQDRFWRSSPVPAVLGATWDLCRAGAGLRELPSRRARRIPAVGAPGWLCGISQKAPSLGNVFGK